MRNSQNYKNTEDLIGNQSFKRWVKFGENNDFWEAWILESPERGKLAEDASLLILAMKVNQKNFSKAEISIALHTIWNKIDQSTNKPIELKWWRLSNTKVAAAIVVIGLSLISFYKLKNMSFEPNFSALSILINENQGLIEQQNNSDKPQLIILSDGSSILLQPKSKLSYPKKFSIKDRKVYLSGEAFFEISKNPKKPFFVYSNDVRTEVYGTSFRVKAFDNQAQVEISVKTGKVKVSSEKFLKEEIFLLPNQATRFIKEKQTFETIRDISLDISLQNSKTAIENLSFEFTDTPISQIFKTIEQAYDVEIEYPKTLMKDCYLTTTLTDEPLNQKLSIISSSIGKETRFEINGDKIKIISLGCN